MGWAARANQSAAKAKAAKYRKPVKQSDASRRDEKRLRAPLAMLIATLFGIGEATKVKTL